MMRKNKLILIFSLIVSSLCTPSLAADSPAVVIEADEYQFGHAVAYAHPWLVVTARGEGIDFKSGRVLIYREISDNNFELVQTLHPEYHLYRRYGEALAIVETPDQFVLALTIPYLRQVRIFTTDLDGTSWTHQQTLTGSFPQSDFGQSVDITATRLIVGGDDRALIYANTSTTSIPNYVFQTEKTRFQGSGFGASVAIGFSRFPAPGRIIYAVGAPNYRTRGGVFLHTENVSTVPQPITYFGFVAGNDHSGDEFGAALDMDGELMIVGAPGVDGPVWQDMGAAIIYRVLDSVDAPGTVEKVTVWTAFDGNTNRQQTGARFGSSVAIKRWYDDTSSVYTAASGAPEMLRNNKRDGAGFVKDVYFSNGTHWEVRNPAPGDPQQWREGTSIAIGGSVGSLKIMTGSPNSPRGKVQVYD